MTSAEKAEVILGFFVIIWIAGCLYILSHFIIKFW